MSIHVFRLSGGYVGAGGAVSDALLASLRDVLAGRVGRGYTDADIGRFHDQRDGNACERYAEYFAGRLRK